MADWDDEIDELYALDPGEFVAARNALAKRIKAEGDKERAAEVARLGRPTVVAWALNQAARQGPAQVDELIEAAGRVATGQEELLNGGDASAMRAASTEQRAAAAAVVRTAATFAGPNHADTLRNTLDAAVADPELVDRLRAGTLSDTLDAPAGFGFGFGLGVAESPPASRRRSTRPSRDRTATTKGAAGDDADPGDEDLDAARRAAEEAEEAEAAKADARAGIERLEEQVATAEQEADEADAAVERAAREREEAEDALAAARAALADSTVAHEEADERRTERIAERDRLRSALDEGRAQLERLEHDG